MPRSPWKLPAIVGTDRIENTGGQADQLDNQGGLCIFGLPFIDGVVLELYNPAGRLVDKVTYRLGEYNKSLEFWSLVPAGARSGTMKQEASFVEDVEVIYINMWWPEGLPVGRWRAVAKTPYGSVEGQFYLPPPPDKPLVDFGRRPQWIFSNASPLEAPRESYLTRTQCEHRKSGDVLMLYGANFKPGSMVPIGLYQFDWFYTGPTDGEVDLFAQGSVQADRNGEWKVSYRITSSDPPGEYHMAVVLRPDEGHIGFVGPQTCYLITSWEPCQNTYPSRLRAGISAKVNEQPPLANLVRKTPDRNATVVGRLQPGEQFKILDGPSCKDSWVWWYVESKDGMRGWTAEGKANEYWLSPNEYLLSPNR